MLASQLKTQLPPPPSPHHHHQLTDLDTMALVCTTSLIVYSCLLLQSGKFNCKLLHLLSGTQWGGFQSVGTFLKHRIRTRCEQTVFKDPIGMQPPSPQLRRRRVQACPGITAAISSAAVQNTRITRIIIIIFSCVLFINPAPKSLTWETLIIR